MPLFDVFVARGDCVVSLDALKSHPSVKRVTSLPRDWIFYEFYDELLQDPEYLVEGIWEQKMRDQPELRAARIHMLDQERGLLDPWYKATKKLGDADSIAISEICEYRIYSLSPLRLIDFEPSSGWGSSNAFTVTLKAPRASQGSLSELVREWELSSKSRIRLFENLVPGVDGFRLRAECRDYSGHWLVALWVLLCDARFSVGVSQMIASVDASG